jgi:hypothetical protein
MNAAWHKAHVMPKPASLDQRLAWHREHQRQCACRPVPVSLRAHLAAAAAPAPAAARRPARLRPRPVKPQRGTPPAPAAVTADPRFARVVAAFATDPEVSFGGKGFGSTGLKRRGKIFAMLASGGELVVKLPAPRVDELVAAGEGKYFAPRPGRHMKQWLVASPSNRRWLALAREAHRHGGG